MDNKLLEKFSFIFEVKEPIHIDVWKPIIHYLESHGATCTVSKDCTEQATFGFYCSDEPKPGNQEFTIVTINGLDQDHVIRPNYKKFFEKENWKLFDFGFLPGGNWSKGFARILNRSKVSPRFGVYSLGWPKSDPLFIGGDPVTMRRNNLHKILYAPQIEDGIKQKQVANVIGKLQIDLLIKHWESAVYKEVYPWLITDELLTRIEFSNKEVTEKYPRLISLAPTNVNFMSLLNDVDLLITDQSSVLYDSLFAGIPTLVIDDWSHCCGNCPGPQPSPDAIFSVSSSNLEHALIQIDAQYSEALKLAERKRNTLFDHLGTSTPTLLKTIMRVYLTKLKTGDAINIFSSFTVPKNSRAINLNF